MTQFVKELPLDPVVGDVVWRELERPRFFIQYTFNALGEWVQTGGMAVPYVPDLEPKELV